MAEPAGYDAADNTDYSWHGGFPHYENAHPGPGFGRFIAAMRHLQDLAVSTNPDDAVWDRATEQAERLAALLEPFGVPEGIAPSGRVPSLPGMGSLLLPPWRIIEFDPAGVTLRGAFSRYHVGGNSAVHGGVLPLLFDWTFGMVVHATERPISRTAFLHVDYRKVTPIDTVLNVHGGLDEIDGRKAFVSAQLTDEGGTVLAEAHGLMVQLLPGQP